MSEFINIIRNGSTITSVNWIGVCGSHFHHYLAMLFFDFQIRKNKWKDKIKFFSAYIAFINWFAIGIFHLSSFGFFPIIKSEKFRYPFNLGFCDTSKFQNTTMMRFFKWISMFYIIHIKTPISVYISSKIRTINFIHKKPCVKCEYTLYGHYEQIDCVRPERLNEWNFGRSMRKSALYGNIKRDTRRGFPANVKLFYISHKSNRLPVLNSAAARLGQAKMHGLYKSTLMDLELLPRNGEDNKAQATFECAA